MTKKLFVEQRPQGDYKVMRPGAERASATAPTQKAAVAKAHALEPQAHVHIERVRQVGPGRDKWRT